MKQTKTKMEQSAKETSTIKEQLQDILLAVSWREISRTYFGKPNAWLYHKLDGTDNNNNPTEFSYEEKVLLKGALADLADRIRRASDSIKI